MNLRMNIARMMGDHTRAYFICTGRCGRYLMCYSSRATGQSEIMQQDICCECAVKLVSVTRRLKQTNNGVNMVDWHRGIVGGGA